MSSYSWISKNIRIPVVIGTALGNPIGGRDLLASIDRYGLMIIGHRDSIAVIDLSLQPKTDAWTNKAQIGDWPAPTY